MTALVRPADGKARLCQSCQQPLGRSPSDDFCSESCQQHWYAALITELPDQRR